MTIRELVAKFGLDIKGADFKKADRMIENLKKSAVALGSLWAGSKIIQGARRLAQETAALGDGLNVLSQRSGMSIEAIQELRYVGEAAGVAMGQVDGAIFRLARRMGAAINGNKAMAAAFARAGVAIRDASGDARAAEDVMMDLADRMAAMSSDGERAAVGMELMGDTGIAMAAALKGGSAEVRRLREEARELGLIEQELADEASRFVMTQQRVRYSLQAVRNAIASALLPAIREAADTWLRWYRTNRDWLKLKLGDAVDAIAHAFKRIADVGRGLVAVVDWIGQAIGSLARSLTLAALAAGALTLALGLKGAILASLVLLLEDFVTWLEGGESAIGEIVDRIFDALHRLVFADVDYERSPWLAFFRDLASVAMKAGLGLRVIAQGFLRDEEAVREIDEALRLLAEQDARIAHGKAPEFGATEEEQALTERRRQLGLLHREPGFVGPTPEMLRAGALNNNVNVEINFGAADSSSPGAIEDAVRRGVGGALRDAAGSLSPALGVP